MAATPKICVAVRKRPISSEEKDVVTCNSHSNLIVNEPRIKYDLTPYTEKHNFNFDEVFDEKCNNRDVYVRAAQPLIDTVFNKGSASCFCYGQTGSGKTYTMLGKKEEPGLYMYASHDIFARAQKQSCNVFASFYEIYGRKLFDLLNDRAKLVCREDGNSVIQICGLTEHPVSKIEELLKIIDAGSAARAAGQTSANAESSRSHAVLTLEIREMKDQKPVGKMSFIDLAGNERGSDTFDSDRKTRLEGAEINKSLLALKECIRALGMGKSHVPFRGSILTEVLRDSFLGNSRTCMIAAISPAAPNCEHTLNTLRYTSRVKELGPGGKPASNKNDAVTNPAQRYKRGDQDGDSKAVKNNVKNNNNNNNNANANANNNNVDAKYEARAAALAERLNAENNNNLPSIASGSGAQQQQNKNDSKQSQQQQQPNKGRRAVGGGAVGAGANNNNNKGSKPGWNNDFVEDKIADHNLGNNNKGGPSRKSSNLGSGNNGPSLQPRLNNNNNANKNNNINNKLKDPLIQTIIDSHINQLDEIEAAGSDDDDNDDDNDNNTDTNDDDENTDDNNHNNNNRRGGNNNNKRNNSFKKARAVHQHIVARIRQSEESMIAVHRRHIDSKMQMMKGEVSQLQGLDENSSIDEYVEKVDGLLAKQMREIKDMRDRLAKIGTYLKEEEVLSKTLTPAGKKRM